MEKIQLGKHVSVHKDRVEHIKKHGIDTSLSDIVKLADKWTRGKQGIHVCNDVNKTFTIVVRGIYAVDGKSYGIVRTIWENSVNGNERTGLSIIQHYNQDGCKHSGIIPYFQEPCPWC